MTITTPKIAKAIDERLAELQPFAEEFVELRKIRDNMIVSPTGAANMGALRVARLARRAGDTARPTPRNGPVTSRITEYIRKHPRGVRIKEIADHCNTSTNYAHAVVRDLIEAGLAKRERGVAYPIQG